VDTVVQAFLYLLVDLGAEPGQATAGGLNMTAGTAEPVIEIEMTKGGIEVVAPHQANDPPAEPHAFRVTGRTIDDLGGFREFIGLTLAVLGGVRWAGGGRLAGLVLGGGAATLRNGRSDADHQGKPGDGEATQNCNPKLKHPLTHEFPEPVPAHVLGQPNAVQMGPQYGGDPFRIPMADILDFVQQTHNFIASW